MKKLIVRANVNTGVGAVGQVVVNQLCCNTGPELVASAFALRNAIHKLHLQTLKYSEHKALNSYYDSIVELVDTFAESYQGRTSIIKDYPQIAEPQGDARTIITMFRTFLDEVRGGIQYPELQNTIDEIQTLNNQTLYLLQLS